MFRRKKPLFISMDQKYKKLKRKFYILLTIFILFVLGTSYYIYLNYDYLAFKHFISQNYIYTETLDELYEKELKQNVNGKYYKYFDNVVISIVTREIRELNGDMYTYQYLPEEYEKSKVDEKKEAQNSYVEELSKNAVYLKLTNYSKYTKDFIKDQINYLKDYPNIIIDLRDNRGGDISALYYMSDLFLPKNKILAFDITRSKLFTRTVKSKRKQTLHYDNIIILQNKNTASSSEGFISALKDNLDNVTLIGETTFGKGIGQFTLPLTKGFAIKATTMLWNTPNNINIQEIGISPDIEYTNEDIVEYALKYIE
ncbi:S41 family peptidase [Defluviitalea phaphyphila]|uniref:S41 family peptidase n=1 Tax=Defluviitalea phaphyphila TaxID=1473580 RepID=UPI00072FBDFB|nr:S41 family peptidase [Defluviitalea phaphyphila]